MSTSVPEGKTAGRRWRFGHCEYAEISRKLTVSGQTIRMEPKLVDVLLQLLERPNQVVGKEQLLDTVWSDVETTEQSLTTAVSKLRKTLGGERDSIILNVPGVGYRLAVPVTSSLEEDNGTMPLVLDPGSVIPRRPHWHAIRKLSTNPLSPVWMARHEKTGEERVYKFATDGVRLRALQREVTIFRLLTKALGERADFVVRIFEWDFAETPFFTESEFCGANLLEWSNSESFHAPPLETRIRMATSLASSITLAHSVAVFHNDLKPTNILLADGSPEPKVKIADFGVASLQEPGLLLELDISDLGSFDGNAAASSGPVGTAMYRAPELQAGGPPTAAGDVYALGVLIYQIISCNFHEPPSPGWEQKIPDPLLRLDIAAAADVDPAQRIATVAALATRLQTLDARREEKQRQDQAARETAETQEALARTRLRRPWVVLTIALLAFGLAVTLFSVHRAVRNRDDVRRRNATLEAMYDFLAVDLLGQSNPYLKIAGTGHVAQQTLVSAIATAVPQIDARFLHQPEVAGRLHETVADSLKSRTRYREADAEYALAAQRFRSAEGRLSQQAIRVELKRETVNLASGLPGAVQAAQEGFEQQEGLLAQLHPAPAELQAWETLVKTGLIGMGPHPADSLPLLTAAVQRAEGTPGFDPTLLVRLKNQFCGIYVRMGDGANLERTSREMIDLLTRLYGAESPTIFLYQMYIEEALYLQGKYPEAIAQADTNAARFMPVLGGDHQLTIATLATRAAAEVQLERYGDAARDDLALYAAASLDPSAMRLKEGSLGDAALSECRRGDFPQGIEHARQVIKETGPGPDSQPIFFNGAMFTVAECLITQQERATGRDKAPFLDEADSLLHKVDFSAMPETAGDESYERAGDIAFARLALLRGDFPTARQHLARTETFFTHPKTDPYERRAFQVAKKALAAHLP